MREVFVDERFVLSISLLLILLLLGDRCDDHLTCQCREGSGDVDVLFRTDPVGVEKSILLSKFLYTIVCLQIIKICLVNVLQFVHFIDAEHYGYRLSIH